ncbi:hypothetical protein KCMC57_64860 (plasmid) [Kitasatospora sp. CMC57]|uniref:Phosphoadenosine phosphosulphate reductase domain-containing protein n=1 Tax=Kitasatospora sp. CMC57 TaxID=3231513 RepID=A0AB33KE44_9ACTN
MPKHIVMWSGGITSWATARWVIDRHGPADVTLLFADTNAEDPDLHRFNAEASAQLGIPVTRVADPKERDPWQVFEDKQWLGNTRLAQCSLELKIQPCRTWLAANTDPADTMLYVGIDWTETHRLPVITEGWLPWTVDAPLTRPPYADKTMLLAELKALHIRRPNLYRLGFEHNNCGALCVKGGQGHWLRVLKVFPDRFAKIEAFEQRMRAKLGDVSILRDRTDGTLKPLTLAALRQRADAAAEEDDQLDLFDIGGCGCFTDAA